MIKSTVMAALAAISFIAAPVAAATNLVTNGSFETGDFSGWIEGGDTSFSFVTDEPAGGGPTDGIYHAAFGPIDGYGGIIQELATTAGSTYFLSFDIASLSDTPPNAFFLYWDGIYLIDDSNFPAFDYVTASGYVTASTNSTTLVFGFYNPPSYFLLDNISVTTVPEPASWALMIAGFGMIGAAMRRRSALVA
jgi:hypothetical protein